ncbi:MFS transporter [Crossiella sp. CA198]|uniref:MFS transporter n=1 Tax=Crossiella sp. CA198 TaxID=3455607 RepID=UPI003F8D6B35
MPASTLTGPRARLVIIVLCGLALAFDGYDLVVYGTTIQALRAEWGITASEAGTIGSAALVGMLVGALLAGTLTDTWGRRKTFLLCVTWFSVLTALCAAAPSPEVFLALRFLAGIGLGGLMPTAATLTIEYAAAKHRTFTYAAMQSGYAVGGILAATLAIPLLPTAGWRVMYLVGAAPLILVLPLALRHLPESLEYLVSHGRQAEAEALAARLGVPVPPPAERRPGGLSGVKALIERTYLRRTVLFWLASFCALLLVYGLNTWLPEIMRASGYPLGSALGFLLAFNLGSVAGALLGGRLSDRHGARPVLLGSFVLAAVCSAALSVNPGQTAIYLLVAVSGYGTIGTMHMLNAHVTRSYPASMRATGIGWALGVGRLGAILGPTLGGWVLDSELGPDWNFYLFTVVAVLGALAITALPRRTSAVPETAISRTGATP